jgi:hypothetical protein
MSDYFSTVKQGLGDAVERRSHLRWYSRLRLGHGRALIVVFAGLAIATPAVGAVTNWFSFGKPDAPVAGSRLFGAVKPGDARLLPVRVADPQGGPAWGLQLVRTSGDNTCLQVGRVEAGKLGSLGIDGAWNNDHEFHVLGPAAAYDDTCGSTDAVGDGYGNWAIHGDSASANPSYGAFGPQSTGCKLHEFGGPPRWPYCPPGTNRIVVFGMLGRDATSITYRKLGGGLATLRTVGGVGAYLLVFPYNRTTCDTYNQALPSCGGEAQYGLTPSPLVITAVHYTDGRSCNLARAGRLASEWNAVLRASGPRSRRVRLMSQLLKREHLTNDELARAMYARCRAVGWVAFKQRRLSASEIHTTVHLQTYPAGTYPCPENPWHLPHGCNYPSTNGHGVKLPLRKVIPVEWSFTARRAVTTNRSWYAWELRYPRGCGAGGEASATRSRVRSGQLLRYSTFVDSRCRGTYTLTVGFMPQEPPGMLGPSRMRIGRDGSLIVGRASFTIR